MAYLLDSDALIEAKKRWYGLDFCPAYWDWIDRQHANGLVDSVEAVANEVLAGDDDLVDWVRARPAMFLRPDEVVVAAFGAVMAWANTSTDYEPVAKAIFAEAADSWLIAQAVVSGHTVVTHEVADNSRRRIKIPEAAAAFDVGVMHPFLMLRSGRARFVLDDVTR